jgi:hypothetical protein
MGTHIRRHDAGRLQVPTPFPSNEGRYGKAESATQARVNIKIRGFQHLFLLTKVVTGIH